MLPPQHATLVKYLEIEQLHLNLKRRQTKRACREMGQKMQRKGREHRVKHVEGREKNLKVFPFEGEM